MVKTEERASGDAWTRERDGQGGKKEGGRGMKIGRFDGSLVSAVRVSTDAHHRRCTVLMGP